MKLGTYLGAMVLGIAVLYVLSIGPVAAWAVRRGGMEQPVRDRLRTIYWPLVMVGEKSDTAVKVIEGYISLWEPLFHLPPHSP